MGRNFSVKKRLLFWAWLFFLPLLAAEKPIYLLIDGKPGIPVATPFPEGKEKIRLVAPENGKTVPLLADAHKAYRALPDDLRLEKFSGTLKTAKKIPENCNQVKLVWQESANETTLLISESPDMAQAMAVKTNKNGISLGNLKIATRYYWQVAAKNGKSEIFYFDTEDVAPRVMWIPGTWNVRDLGGRKGCGGRRIRQGMLFRSAGLNENSENGKAGRGRLNAMTRKYVTENLGWKTDLDLRYEKECLGMSASPAGEGVKWVSVPSSMYSYIVDKEFGRGAFKTEFKLLLDEKNYPLVFHCINGKDRTGTLAYILLALLGADEKEIALDWEFTRLCKPSAGLEYRWIEDMRRGFARYAPGDTVHGQIEKWALSLGITAEEIEKFRAIMLE